MRKSKKQMSESFRTAAFLSVSGGLQDAYTYIFRDKVFANAQTGNIVLLSQCIANRDLELSIHYIVPLLFFEVGIAVAELIHCKFKDASSRYRCGRDNPRQIQRSQTPSLAAAGFDY